MYGSVAEQLRQTLTEIREAGLYKAERELAFANIRKAAKHYDVELSESSATDVGVHPQSAAHKHKRIAARAAH